MKLKNFLFDDINFIGEDSIFYNLVSIFEDVFLFLVMDYIFVLFIFRNCYKYFFDLKSFFFLC